MNLADILDGKKITREQLRKLGFISTGSCNPNLNGKWYALYTREGKRYLFHNKGKKLIYAGNTANPFSSKTNQ